MRKKNHKKINPRNYTYDKFYIVNYLEFGKSWKEVRNSLKLVFVKITNGILIRLNELLR